ncbi:MAG: hypothetical protein U7127_03005 [Phormidium sp.]
MARHRRRLTILGGFWELWEVCRSLIFNSQNLPKARYNNGLSDFNILGSQCFRPTCTPPLKQRGWGVNRCVDRSS